eukprot:3045033-Amphidinium_carterae.1
MPDAANDPGTAGLLFGAAGIYAAFLYYGSLMEMIGRERYIYIYMAAPPKYGHIFPSNCNSSLGISSKKVL